MLPRFFLGKNLSPKTNKTQHPTQGSGTPGRGSISYRPATSIGPLAEWWTLESRPVPGRKFDQFGSCGYSNTFGWGLEFWVLFSGLLLVGFYYRGRNLSRNRALGLMGRDASYFSGRGMGQLIDLDSLFLSERGPGVAWMKEGRFWFL